MSVKTRGAGALARAHTLAFNARQRPDRFSCPLLESLLHSYCQGFEKVAFLPARDLEFVQ